MTASVDGFTITGPEIPAPLVPVSDEVRDRLVLILAAAVWRSRTPAEIQRYRMRGFPASVRGVLDEPHVRAELDELVDLLLVEQQSPAPVQV